MLTVDQFPDRLPTGVKKQTIHVPKGYFFGDPDDFDFKRLTPHYQSFKALFEQHGLKFSYMSACPRHWPENTNQMRFVVIVGDPTKPYFIWEKYEGNNPRGAQNRVYVGGQMYRTSEFFCLEELRLSMLLTPTEREKW